MKLNELQPQEGAVKKRMRVGRGIGSGKGKTCGRGQKGQKSRTGVAINGFEGGQMPLYRRLPKFGFFNHFAKDYATLSLAQLQAAIDAGTIDAKEAIHCKMLMQAGIVSKAKDGVRLLGNGELKSKVTLKIAGATASAKAAVEKAGGSLEIIVPEVKPVVRKKAIPGQK
ncbi:MAG: 50S ribosomal protein L15 [Pseudobdellovibrionaceae bacterium]|jgi:large subunit ribosomal protein L15|nr:50S ribosomal protein L15 [Pseudobdellovibrionaceae bacterium]